MFNSRIQLKSGRGISVPSTVRQAAWKEVSFIGEGRHSNNNLGNIIPIETLLLISDIF